MQNLVILPKPVSNDALKNCKFIFTLNLSLKWLQLCHFSKEIQIEFNIQRIFLIFATVTKWNSRYQFQQR